MKTLRDVLGTAGGDVTIARRAGAPCGEAGAPRRIALLLGGIALVAMMVVTGPVFAQQEEQEQEEEQEAAEREGGGTVGSFVYVYPTTFEYVADRGYSEAITEQVFLFIPAVLSAGNYGHNGSIYAVYEPEFEILSGHGEINSINHAGAVTTSWNATRNLVFHAGGSVLKTNDPARRIPDTVVVLPRGELLETAFFAGLAYELGRFTSIELRADHTISDLEAAEAFGALAVDHQGTAGTIAISRVVGREKVLSGSYSYLKPQLNAAESLKQDPELVWVPPGDRQHHLSVSYGFALGATTDMIMSAGAVYIDDVYPIGSLELRHISRDFNLKLRYSRLAGQFAGFLTREEVEDQLPLPLPEGMLLKILSHMVAFEIDGYLTDTIRLRNSLRGSQSGFEGIELDSFTLAGAVNVEFRTKETVRPFVGFEYLGDGLSPGIRRRFIGGLNINLWGPQSTAAENLEYVRRSSALPYGHR